MATWPPDPGLIRAEQGHRNKEQADTARQWTGMEMHMLPESQHFPGFLQGLWAARLPAQVANTVVTVLKFGVESRLRVYCSVLLAPAVIPAPKHVSSGQDSQAPTGQHFVVSRFFTLITGSGARQSFNVIGKSGTGPFHRWGNQLRE